MPATYEPIATTTLGSAATNITFSSIGSGYTDLRLVLVGTGDAMNSGVRFNSDTASNYSETTLQGNGSSATSLRTTSGTYIKTNGNVAVFTTPMVMIIDIFSYAGSTNKTVLSALANDNNGSGAVDYVVGLWRSTSAITSVTAFAAGGSWQIGTTATLYGILKA